MSAPEVAADPVRYSVDTGIAIVTLDDQATRNALSRRVIDLIVDAVERANADANVKCLVLTGAGGSFCSGGDMKEVFAKGAMVDGSPQDIRAAMVNFQRVARALQALEVPSLAAINGAAVGGGFDLALGCDIRLASDNARLIQRFLTLGVVAADGGWWLLPRIVGAAKALEISLLDQPIGAEQALQLGLVSAVFKQDELMQKTIEYARTISRHPPQAIRLAKRLIQHSARCDFDSSLEMAAAMQVDLYRTEDQREAVAAFLEKRQPHFKGR